LAALKVEPNTEKGLREALGKSQRAIKHAVEALKNAGLIVPTKVARGRGQNHDGYKVAP